MGWGRTTKVLWTITGIVVSVLVGVAIGMVGLTPPEFYFAKACFYLSAIILGITTFIWAFVVKSKFSSISIIILVFLFIGISLPKAIDWVNKREMLSISTHKPPPKPPENPPITATLGTKKPEKPPEKKEPKGTESGQQKTLENIETMMKYENTPKFQIEDVNISDKHISDVNIKWPSRLFVYNAVLHNVGTRVLSVSGIYFCVLKPDEKGCPRSYHIASEFMLEPGGKWPFSFDTSQWFKSDPVLELENIELFLQIEYINPDRSTSVLQKWITGFRGGGVEMRLEIKAPRQK